MVDKNCFTKRNCDMRESDQPSSCLYLVTLQILCMALFRNLILIDFSSIRMSQLS